METNNLADKRICTVLGLTQSHLDMLRSSPDYNSTFMTNVDDPAEAIRQSMQNTAIKASERLEELVQQGDMDAIKVALKSVGADKPAETQMADTTKFFLDLLVKVGIKSHDRKASDQIEQLKSKKKELKSAEQLEDEKIMDAEYEILGDDDVDDELKSEVPVKKQSDMEDTED